jgi:integrase
MSVRKIRNHGTWVWQARVAYQGLRKAAFRDSRDAARHAEAELLAALKRRAAEAQQDGQRPATLRALFEYYVADLDARGKGRETIGRAAQTGRAVELVMPEALDRPIRDFGARAIFAYRQARHRAGIKPATINRDLRVLRAMLKPVLPDFRFPGGAFFPEDDTRVRWLRPDEEILVLEPMGSPFREMAKLAHLTLMRLSEIRLLRREMVHLEQGVVLLPTAKGGARPVILSAAARKILTAQLEGHADEVVFPRPDGQPYSRVHVSRMFKNASRAAGLRDFHFHDLRHHGATMALNAGFTAPIVMALGGWKSEKMMRRYAAITDQTLRAAAEAVSGSEYTPTAPGRTAAPQGIV